MTKIHKNSFNLANQQDIFSEYLFYLVIKSISIPGFLRKGNYLKQIQNQIKKYNSNDPIFRLPTSLSQILRLVNRCKELGFLRKNSKGVYLNSYYKIWTILGCKIRSRMYYKLDQVTFFEDCYLTEIKRNLKAQRRKIRESHQVKSASGVLKTRLSCFGFSKLLGFHSASFGLKIRNYFEKRGLLKVVVHKPFKLKGFYPYDQVFKIGTGYFYRHCTEIYQVL